MLAVPVYNMKGDKVGETEIDPAVLGGKVRPQLLKQAVVAYLAHKRQYSARQKRRSDVKASTKKLYRQKGTGNARAGMASTPIRRGGGRAFATTCPRRTLVLPKKMKRLARDSALLAKIQSERVMVVDGLICSQPKTKALSAMFSAMGIGKSCILAMHEADQNIMLSGRNIANADIRLVADLNAYDVLRRECIIMTKQAFDLLSNPGSGESVDGSEKN